MSLLFANLPFLAAGAEKGLALSLTSDRSIYGVGDTVRLILLVSNPTKRAIQFYHLQIHEPGEFLRIESASGERFEAIPTAQYVWENPAFPVIASGGVFRKVLEGRILKEGKRLLLRFGDVEYDLGGSRELRVFGRLGCDVALASEYGRKFPEKVKRKLWTGRLASKGFEMRIR